MIANAAPRPFPRSSKLTQSRKLHAKLRSHVRMWPSVTYPIWQAPHCETRSSQVMSQSRNCGPHQTPRLMHQTPRLMHPSVGRYSYSLRLRQSITKAQSPKGSEITDCDKSHYKSTTIMNKTATPAAAINDRAETDSNARKCARPK